MDAFFASVEQLDHPEWRGRPVIVGSGPHERGVVSTCSYEARRFGVHSAMPSRTAYERCPHAIFTRPRMERYHEISARAFEIFARFSPFVEGVSVDEAFLDITGNLHFFRAAATDAANAADDSTATTDATNAADDSPLARARRLGEALRAAIRRECGVTCSVGIASNRLLAKIGSERRKPDGLTVMPFEPAEIVRYLAPLPLDILWGAGKATVAELAVYGVKTCGDLQRLAAADSPLARKHAALVEHAFGRASDVVRWQPEREKSLSNEYTFAEDEHDRDHVRARLLSLVDEVGARFRAEPRWAQTARIKLRDPAFVTITRQQQFEHPARDDFAFRKAALELFDRERLGAVRLVGFGVSDFVDSPDADAQLRLFEEPETEQRLRREQLSETLDRLRERGMSVTGGLTCP